MNNKIQCKTIPNTEMRPEGFLGIQEIIDILHENITMVEVGCYYGESTLMWASSNKITKIYAIDPWKDFYDPNDGASQKGNMAEVEKIFDENTSNNNKIIKIKKPSILASLDFEDNSLDFVYLDGSHKHDDVVDDIKNWLPKIKKDGYIGGHDISWMEVRVAVMRTIGDPDKTFGDTSWIKKVSK